MYENNFYPLPQDKYNNAMLSKLQARALSPAGIEEIASMERERVRNANKVSLMISKEEQKQAMKSKKHEICIRDNAVVLEIIDGRRVLIQSVEFFKCEVKEVRSFQRIEAEEILWQVVLIDKDKKEVVEGPLYDSKMLHSLTKLQTTILSRYNCSLSPENNRVAWKWMQKQLITMIELKKPIKIPCKPGWFNMNEKWSFWTNTEEKLLFSNQNIKKFYIEKFDDLEVKEVVSIFVDDAVKMKNMKIVGILLITRLIALMGRLATDSPFRFGVTLVGKYGENVATSFLRTMHNEVDIVNIDTDRIGVIREKAKCVQETPMIFISSSPDSRSTQNRINEVTSWMQSGYVEGDKVQIPYVFCLQKFAKEYPLESTIVLNTNDIGTFNEHVSFVKMQSIIITKIETSGTYWVEECRRIYAENEDKETQMEKYMVNQLVSTIIKVVAKMFDSDLVGQNTHESFVNLLYAGQEEIIKQFSLESGKLLEIFKEKVIELVSQHRVLIEMREETTVELNLPVIYFDEFYYYFIKDCIQFVCDEAEMDVKSVLYVKQQLANENVIKMYRNAGQYGRNFEVDFTILNAYGQRKKCSGIAVNREFFDSIGGIALFERGGKSNA